MENYFFPHGQTPLKVYLCCPRDRLRCFLLAIPSLGQVRIVAEAVYWPEQLSM